MALPNTHEDGIQTQIYDQGAGGDAVAKARTEASNVRRRVGSTPGQRKGLDPYSYIPGYGAPATANVQPGTAGQTNFDALFQHAQPQGPTATGATMMDPHAISNPVAAPLGAPSALNAPANPGAFDHYVPPMNNLVPGQAATNSLANHVQVTPNLPINPRATGNESAGAWQAIQQGSAAAYAPGGMSRIDPYQTTAAPDLAGIAARYGTPGGTNGVAFVHDPRSFVDASGAQLPNANPQFRPTGGVSPAGAHNDLNGPAQIAAAKARGTPAAASNPRAIDAYATD